MGWNVFHWRNALHLTFSPQNIWCDTNVFAFFFSRVSRLCLSLSLSLPAVHLNSMFWMRSMCSLIKWHIRSVMALKCHAVTVQVTVARQILSNQSNAWFYFLTSFYHSNKTPKRMNESTNKRYRSLRIRNQQHF